jgi:tRNA 5-methylaminomethyl-2-thiouridine biosynthesis bifunctional protein
MMQTTTQAALEWRDGLPYSTAFDDVYFSSDDGLLETEYVFIQGNALVSRWQSLAENSFTILETGFGTGLNFLCACKCWLEHAPANTVLHFTSVEKYPLSCADLHKALQHWQSLKPFADELLTQYETLLNTGTAILFNNRIKLQVLFGDATACISKLDTKADAWFLDGFAPSKNPEMWQQALFEQMARLSHLKTTFATFTSAGVVRRGLTAAGFRVNKQPGFGKKREMINGYFASNHHGS